MNPIAGGALLTLLVLLTACVAPPQLQSENDSLEALAVPARWQTLPAPVGGFSSDRNIRSGLLKLFDDAALASIVDQALMHNLDLSLAAVRMEEAESGLKVARSELFPSATGNLGVVRSRSDERVRTTSYDIGVDVAWEVDIWGRLREQANSRRAEFDARAEEYEYARDSVAAQTMQAWYLLIAAQRQVDLQAKRIKSLGLTQKTIEQRYRSGLTTVTDLNAARTRLAQETESQLQLQEEVIRIKRHINLLLGQYPDADVLTGKQLPELLAPPPAGIPAQVLSRRPDLRAAWQLVLAADANTQVSYRAMFPRLSLTTNIGRRTNEFSKLMSAPSVWSVAANLMAPLFDAGRLRNQYRVVQKDAERAYVNYLRSSLLAFQESENALSQENSLAKRELALQRALVFAKRTYMGAEQDYRNGSISILDLLSAQLNLFDIESSLVNVRNARLQNRITLALALGLGV